MWVCAELLQKTIQEDNLNWCLQAEQLGTGHAVKQATPFIQPEDDVLVLVGDAPLIKSETLAQRYEVLTNIGANRVLN